MVSETKPTNQPITDSISQLEALLKRRQHEHLLLEKSMQELAVQVLEAKARVDVAQARLTVEKAGYEIEKAKKEKQQ
jgi:ABC-type Zn uptake system ZnuABC Zn-binding protein ZnuA